MYLSVFTEPRFKIQPLGMEKKTNANKKNYVENYGMIIAINYTEKQSNSGILSPMLLQSDMSLILSAEISY